MLGSGPLDPSRGFSSYSYFHILSIPSPSASAPEFSVFFFHFGRLKFQRRSRFLRGRFYMGGLTSWSIIHIQRYSYFVLYSQWCIRRKKDEEDHKHLL